jgi:tetratricopeptide (TPR) repeat protein
MNIENKKLEEGIAAANKGDYQFALDIFQPLADQENAVAQYYLGRIYELGLGVAKDPVQAMSWYRKSAGQDFASSQVRIGWMYNYGYGDNWEYGVEKDYAEAMKWYRKAADQGDAEAIGNIGRLYHHGLGVPKDTAEAIRWWRKTADKGNFSTQETLGRIYQYGHGVEKDLVQSYFWYILSIRNTPAGTAGFKGLVQGGLKHLVKHMTPEQLAEAKRLISEWKPVTEKG